MTDKETLLWLEGDPGMKIVVRAKEVVNDIRDGMLDYHLMEKYGLSPKGLQSVFKK